MNNELRHHGVKGMRWGIRKDRIASSSKPKKTRKRKTARDRVDNYMKGRHYVEAKFFEKFDKDDLMFIRDSAAYASAVLWTASAIASGNPFDSAAALANLLSNIADPD